MTDNSNTESSNAERLDFVRQIVANDLKTGKWDGRVVTRFPPEPNGYLHIGHAKSISVNFGLAEQFGGVCNLRFDDTNPEKESQEYIESILDNVRWLGYSWDGEVRYASSYFQQLYDWAVVLVEQDDAYVCDLSADEAREYRGTLTEPGRNSPYRERPVGENLELLERMKQLEQKSVHFICFFITSAISSANVEISSILSPSTITLIFGSVPDGLTRTRPQSSFFSAFFIEDITAGKFSIFFIFGTRTLTRT